MLSDRKISKGGLIGGIIGLVVSLFNHKKTDTTGTKILKSGTMGFFGYILGSLVENKIKKYRNSKG